jgi:hypothetical protein
MCALTAGYRGRKVVVIDHANKAGKKILMSGGGRCNFTHLDTGPEHFLSSNPPFCISALHRYTPAQFVELVERHGIEYVEKTPGQLFCRHSSKAILQMLLAECEWAGVEIALNTEVRDVVLRGDGVRLQTSNGTFDAGALVVASGGLSIPTMGASGFGYELARQFGIPVLDTRAGLVPFTMQPEDRQRCAELAGVSTPVAVQCDGREFREPLLFTHRGLSGPAMLQASSYWSPGQPLVIDWLPDADATRSLQNARRDRPSQSIAQALAGILPRRLAAALCQWHQWQGDLQSCSGARLEAIGHVLAQDHWSPAGTEGYRTAEVTLGGVDTRALSSRTFAVAAIPQMYFIGEVLDVSGQLGGYNFQWAWASGYCAGHSV